MSETTATTQEFFAADPRGFCAPSALIDPRNGSGPSGNAPLMSGSECAITGCTRTNIHAKNLCRYHYMATWPGAGTCAIEACGMPRHAHRLCVTHYRLSQRHSNDDLLSYLGRFIDKVTFTPTCWVWNSGRTAEGYGAFATACEGVNDRAYRYAYITFVGPIAAGMAIDHLCRNRLCVRPEHLEQVTGAENTRRGNVGRRLLRQQEQCREHQWNPERSRANGREAWVERTCAHCGEVELLAGPVVVGGAA